jgi:hypothetical protein
MNMLEGASRMLSILEQTDEQEYDEGQALRDLNQAIHEISDEGEVSNYNEFVQFDIEADAYSGGTDWGIVPGRVPITTALGVAPSQIAYIKTAWLDSDGATIPFKQVSVIELLNKYGDETGVPERYAIEGDFFYWRPIGTAGTNYTARLLWCRNPHEYAPGEEPSLMAKAPYACIYKACSLAAVWIGDDSAVAKFDRMSTRMVDKFMIRNSMQSDAPREAEDYNG